MSHLHLNRLAQEILSLNARDMACLRKLLANGGGPDIGVREPRNPTPLSPPRADEICPDCGQPAEAFSYHFTSPGGMFGECANGHVWGRA